MGFFDGFSNGFKSKRESKKIVELYNDIEENDSDYREKAFNNTESSNGWYTCAHCGKKFRKADMDADHILPKSKGGDNSRYNLQVLCSYCNRSKRDDTSQTDDDLRRREKELRQSDKEMVKYLEKI